MCGAWSWAGGTKWRRGAEWQLLTLPPAHLLSVHLLPCLALPRMQHCARHWNGARVHHAHSLQM